MAASKYTDPFNWRRHRPDTWEESNPAPQAQTTVNEEASSSSNILSVESRRLHSSRDYDSGSGNSAAANDTRDIVGTRRRRSSVNTGTSNCNRTYTISVSQRDSDNANSGENTWDVRNRINHDNNATVSSNNNTRASNRTIGTDIDSTGTRRANDRRRRSSGNTSSNSNTGRNSTSGAATDDRIIQVYSRRRNSDTVNRDTGNLNTLSINENGADSRRRHSDNAIDHMLNNSSPITPIPTTSSSNLYSTSHPVSTNTTTRTTSSSSLSSTSLAPEQSAHHIMCVPAPPRMFMEHFLFNAPSGQRNSETGRETQQRSPVTQAHVPNTDGFVDGSGIPGPFSIQSITDTYLPPRPPHIRISSIDTYLPPSPNPISLSPVEYIASRPTVSVVSPGVYVPPRPLLYETAPSTYRPPPQLVPNDDLIGYTPRSSQGQGQGHGPSSSAAIEGRRGSSGSSPQEPIRRSHTASHQDSDRREGRNRHQRSERPRSERNTLSTNSRAEHNPRRAMSHDQTSNSGSQQQRSTPSSSWGTEYPIYRQQLSSSPRTQQQLSNLTSEDLSNAMPDYLSNPAISSIRQQIALAQEESSSWDTDSSNDEQQHEDQQTTSPRSAHQERSRGARERQRSSSEIHGRRSSGERLRPATPRHRQSSRETHRRPSNDPARDDDATEISQLTAQIDRQVERRNERNRHSSLGRSTHETRPINPSLELPTYTEALQYPRAKEPSVEEATTQHADGGSQPGAEDTRDLDIGVEPPPAYESLHDARLPFMRPSTPPPAYSNAWKAGLRASVSDSAIRASSIAGASIRETGHYEESTRAFLTVPSASVPTSPARNSTTARRHSSARHSSARRTSSTSSCSSVSSALLSPAASPTAVSPFSVSPTAASSPSVFRPIVPTAPVSPTRVSTAPVSPSIVPTAPVSPSIVPTAPVEPTAPAEHELAEDELQLADFQRQGSWESFSYLL